MNNENENENENIDLYEFFDFTEEVPKSFENECKKYWLEHLKETCTSHEFGDGSYVKDSEGNLYYYHNGLMIKVTERFAEKGKTIGDLIEDLIIYQAKQK